MKERGILFSAPMVRAILEGRKTVTRRIVRKSERGRIDVSAWGVPVYVTGAPDDDGERIRCPYGELGDRLYVKETFATDVPGCEPQNGVSYRADHVDPRGDGPANPMKWKPSIFMPRKLSRITLEVVDVRVERLHDITEEDAIAEGLGLAGLIKPGHAVGCFSRLWGEINGPDSWAANPWVWRVEFRRAEVTR